MEGHGAYNRKSAVQAAGASPALPSLRAAAERVPAPSSGPLVIADYGAAQGRNSLIPVREALSVLRARFGRDMPISVIHTDMPGNDFSELFRLLDEDPASYLRGEEATFALAAGRSFFGPVLPPASVALGWSSWAVQWMSRVPMPIPDHVQAAFSADAAVRAAYVAQAAEDWRLFLRHRARELVPGGRLVVLTMAFDETGDFGYRAALAAMWGGVQDLLAEGLIAAGEVDRMVVPTFARSREDLLAPFAGGDFEGLSVEAVEVFLGEDHIWAHYQDDGDAVGFGARWAAFSRGSVFPSLALGLDPDNPLGPAGFMDALEARMAGRLARAPEPSKLPLATIVLRKEG